MRLDLVALRTQSALAGLAIAATGWAVPQLQAQTKTVAAVPHVVQSAEDRGIIASGQDLRVAVWLQMKDSAAFKQALNALYTPGSPTYHQWMKKADLLKYAQTDADRKQVVAELSKEGLTVTDSTDPFVIRLHGSADAVQRTFGTEIHTFASAGKTFYANVSEAKLEGAAGTKVLSVSGLSSYGPKPLFVRPTNPKTKSPIAPIPITKVKQTSGGLQGFYVSNCFSEPLNYLYSGKSYGKYSGVTYSPNGESCGLLPIQVQKAYGLDKAYAAGLAGEGQTIVIVDSYGSSTIQSDANEFNTLTNLPQLTSSNFSIVYPDGPALFPELGISEGWNVETSLDVEWAHAIAPAAKIVLEVLPSQDDQDFQLGVYYAAVNGLGNVISNSYGIPELEHGPATLDAYDLVIGVAAASGISVNYSSGDGGDEGLGAPIGSVLTPSDDPYATAVGGTSLGIPNGAGQNVEVGWGNNQTLVAYASNEVADPPLHAGNVGGAGGGESVYFAQPSWQNVPTAVGVPGPILGRLVPDVATLADPYTGAVFVYTDPVLGLIAEPIGGTSLACPIFSGIWALANQKAGVPLGQAAPIIAALSGTNAMIDIVPVSSPNNLKGTVTDSHGTTSYSSVALAQPLENTTKFVSAVWPVEGLFIDLTFGTDSSLQTAAGWDDITGYGRPNGLTFINDAAAWGVAAAAQQ